MCEWAQGSTWTFGGINQISLHMGSCRIPQDQTISWLQRWRISILWKSNQKCDIWLVKHSYGSQRETSTELNTGDVINWCKLVFLFDHCFGKTTHQQDVTPLISTGRLQWNVVVCGLRSNQKYSSTLLIFLFASAILLRNKQERLPSAHRIRCEGPWAQRRNWNLRFTFVKFMFISNEIVFFGYQEQTFSKIEF